MERRDGETARRRVTREAAEVSLRGVILSGLVAAKDLLDGSPSLWVKRPSWGEKIPRDLKVPQDDIVVRTGRRPDAGSTLIELIVVLALIALLFGVTIPALTAVPQAASSGQTADSLRYASVRSGLVVVGDSLVAFPDGRLLTRGAPDAR